MNEPVPVIHLIHDFGFGGAERQLVTLLGGLDRRRWRPLLGCLAKVGPFLEEVRAAGVEPRELPLRGSFARPNTLWQALRLAAWARREQAAVIHAHDLYSNLLAALARWLGAPAKIVASRRDLGHGLSPLERRALAAASRQADVVLANAHAVRDHAALDGVPAQDVLVVHGGIDLDRFDEAARAPVFPEVSGLGAAATIVMLANMNHAVKGHPVLLDAMVRVKARIPFARLLLVGDGPLRPELERDARALGLAGSATFIGRRCDVPALLSRCSIAVSASHAGGLSNAILEAMAARLPVVATDAGGSRELVEHGLNGYLVTAGDAVAMAARIVKLLFNVTFARKMGEEGRRRVERRFTSARAAERVGALYDALVEDRPPGVVVLPTPSRAVR